MTTGKRRSVKIWMEERRHLKICLSFLHPSLPSIEEFEWMVTLSLHSTLSLLTLINGRTRHMLRMERFEGAQEFYEQRKRFLKVREEIVLKRRGELSERRKKKKKWRVQLERGHWYCSYDEEKKRSDGWWEESSMWMISSTVRLMWENVQWKECCSIRKTVERGLE